MPKDFFNIVGNFAIHSTIDKEELSVGESASLKITVSGKGNFSSVSDIKLNNFDTNLEVFDGGTPSVEKNEGRTLSKTWTFALVPKQEGTFNIDPVSISYFNPETKSYSTISSKKYTLYLLWVELLYQVK